MSKAVVCILSSSLVSPLCAGTLLLLPFALQAQESVTPAATKAPSMPDAKAAAKQEPAALAPSHTVLVSGQAASYDARRHDTATKIVVTSEEIVKHGDVALGEVLKRLPGITIGGVQGRGGAIQMRGMGGYTRVLLNGEATPAGFSLDQVAPEMVERIEIMRAATAEYSTQAIAGTINIVLKRSVASAQREVKAGVQVENGKPGATVNLQLSDKKGQWSYSLPVNLSVRDALRPEAVAFDSVTDAAGTLLSERVTRTIQSARLKNFNLAPRMSWTLNDNETLTAQTFLTFNSADGLARDATATSLGPAPVFVQSINNLATEALLFRTDLAWTRKLGGGAKFDMKAGGNRNERKNKSNNLLYDAGGRMAMLRTSTLSGSDYGLSSTGKYSTPIGSGHALATGWDASYSDREDERAQRETSSVGLATEDFDETYQATIRRFAAYAQDEWNVTKQWSVYLGLRWEGIETRAQRAGNAPIINRSSVLSPIFQSLWKIPGTKSDQVRLALTRTYKAPDAQRLIARGLKSINNTANSPDTRGNPNLKPELALGLDLAYERYWSSGAMFSVSTFVRKLDGYIRNVVALENGRYVASPANVGTATTRGIEMEAKLPLRSVFASAPALDLRANVNRNWSSVDSVPGPWNRLDQQTPFSGSVGVDYKASTLPLTMGGSFSFQAGGPLRISQNQYAYTAYKRVLDAYTLWKFNPKAQLRVSVSNALHQDNISASAYVDGNFTQSQEEITPTSAQIRATLEVRF
ncbi:MAG: TonB-dependent receptor [Pseudomonadota bacterium]